MSRRAYFDFTDAGNAERLCTEFGSEFRYVPNWGQFVVWTGRYWEPDVEALQMMSLAKAMARNLRDGARDIDDEEKQKKQRAWALTSRARARLEALISLAKSEDGVAVSHTSLDKNTWLFNCVSGTIDLKTGKLRKHAQRDMLTKMAPVKYVPGATSKRWEAFLLKILPIKEVREYLQRFIGYCLTGEVSERQFVILHGGGRNGKSLLLRVIQHIMGKYSDTMAPGLLMARDGEPHPTEVADLFGVRLAVASEVKQGKAFDEEQLKRVTGNDVLKARRMREDYWSFIPTHKLMMAVNHKPRVRDVTASFWDRAALIPFDVRIADDEVDRDLFSKLVAEASGILAWAVRGCLAWQKRGLAMPAEVREATQAYREGEDVVGRFLKERCAFGAGSEFVATNEDLARAIKSWCTRNNHYVFGDRTLGERLLGGGAERVTNLGPTKLRGWRGVRVKKLEEGSGGVGDVRGTSPVPSHSEKDKRDTPKRSNVVPFKQSVMGESPSLTSPTPPPSASQSSRRTSRKKVRTAPKRPPPVRPPRGTRPRGRGRKEIA